MKLCLHCHQLSTDRDLSGEALFCPHCGLSFGVRRCRSCKKKPSSPLDATHCVHCGGTTLTDATAYLNLGWAVRLFSIALLFLLLRAYWPALSGAGGIFSLVTKTLRQWLMIALDHILFWVVFFAGLSAFLSFLPKHLVQPWQSAMRMVLQFAFKGLMKIVQGLWQCALWLGHQVFGSGRRT